MSTTQQNFTIKREYKAPKELVFNAFASAEALAEWWGPKGMNITVMKLDFKPKGTFHYKMENAGQVMWGVFNYGNINPHDLIEFTNSFSDEQGNVARAPFSPIWPLEVKNTITLTENNGITTLVISGHPINSTDTENQMFYSFFASMEQGFKGTFDQLEEYLTKTQS